VKIKLSKRTCHDFLFRKKTSWLQEAFFTKKEKLVYSLKLVEYIKQRKFKTVKIKKDKFANKLTTFKLIAHNSRMSINMIKPTNMMKLKCLEYQMFLNMYR